MSEAGSGQRGNEAAASVEAADRVRAVLSVAGRDPGRAVVLVSRIEPGERTRRAARGAGICMAIAVGSLAIPIVHFVMPWLMTIVAVLVWRRIRAQGAELLGVEASCPACGSAVAVPRQPMVWPLEWNCGHCRKRMVFSQEEGHEQHP